MNLNAYTIHLIADTVGGQRRIWSSDVNINRKKNWPIILMMFRIFDLDIVRSGCFRMGNF